jgi:DNA repair photolyase
MFEAIKRFSGAGIRCAVNIDPIIPLVTDSPKDIESILDNCLGAAVRHVFGATLRLRADIWERMKTIINLLDKDDKIKEYHRLFHFSEPIRQGYNLAVDKAYSNTILENLEEAVNSKGMSFDFPHLVGSRYIETNKSNDDKKQLTLMNFI